MPFITAGIPNLADLPARAHADLSDAPQDAHQTRLHTHAAVGDGQTLSPVTINVGTAGIVFPAVQVQVAGDNVLDDIERGEWVATLQDASRSADGQTHTTQIGRYYKVGSFVYWTVNLVMNSIVGLTGGEPAVIAGLPFVSRNEAGVIWSAVGGHGDSLAIPDQSSVSGRIQPNDDVIELLHWSLVSGSTSMTVTEVSAGGILRLSGVYESTG